MNFEPKPEGMSYAEWMRDKGIGMRVITPVRREFGSLAPSQLIPSKVEGGHPSYVISEGALEQEEIDHIALVQEERDIAESKKEKSDTSKAIGNIVTQAKKEPEGKRFSTMKKIKQEGM